MPIVASCGAIIQPNHILKLSSLENTKAWSLNPTKMANPWFKAKELLIYDYKNEHILDDMDAAQVHETLITKHQAKRAVALVVGRM